MKITCESCGAKYTIADDKVRGRKVKIRCKGCGTAIVVDGQQESAGPSTPPEAANAADVDATIPIDTGAPSISAPPPSNDGKWSVNLSETDQRTLSTQEIVDGWKSGLVTTDAFVWREGMADWLPVLESAELASLLKAGSKPKNAKPSQTPAARPASASPPARVSGGRAPAGADLFGAAASAGADEEVAMPAPGRQPGRPPGATAVVDDKPTGARNENSVLFSLDALKAGFAGPAPKQEPPKKGNARAAADDPFGLGGPNAGSFGGGGAMFSLADNSALLTAPAPPEPPKPKIVESFAPGAAMPEARSSKKGMIAVVIIALLIIGGGAAAFTMSAKSKEEAALAAAASAAAAVSQAREEEQKAKAAAERAEQEKQAEAEKARAAAAAASAKSEEKPAASGEPAKAGAPATGPAGAIVKKDAAKKDEKKVVEEKPPAAAPAAEQPFSKASAVSALSAAAGQAPSCKKLGGPTGSGRVTVTFAPSGRVTTANVDGGAFAGTSVGGCVASLFRKAHVPPFSGSAVTVSKSFSIN